MQEKKRIKLKNMNRVIRKTKRKKGNRINSGFLIITQKTNDCSTRIPQKNDNTVSFQQYFSSNVGKNWREPPIMGIQQVHPFCNSQSRARTHSVLVMGLYELLGNPTT
jgi:hypothetical protein